MNSKRYHLTAHIGVYWKGPDIDLGSFRWGWVAYLRARLYMLVYPYRAVTVSFDDPKPLPRSL